MSPQRVRLSRQKGWRKPEGCIVVSRPSRWGNPWAVGDRVEVRYLTSAVGGPGRYGAGLWSCDDAAEHAITDDLAVWLYRQNLLDALAGFGCDEPDSIAERDELRAALAALRGRDLACWCPLSRPCHADVLLELANKP
ncbi:MAG: DUF4326 domain-containing protein [Pseudomonadota bacterium]